MSKPTKGAPTRPAHYTTATEETFRRALASLAKTLPDRHAELTALLDAGRLHDIDAIQAVLEGNQS